MGGHTVEGKKASRSSSEPGGEIEQRLVYQLLVERMGEKATSRFEEDGIHSFGGKLAEGLLEGNALVNPGAIGVFVGEELVLGGELWVGGEDDAKGLVPIFCVLSPERQGGVVRAEGLAPDKNGVALASPALDIFARFFARDPLPLARAERGSAVEGCRRLGNDPGKARRDATGKEADQGVRFVFENAGSHFTSGLLQEFESAPDMVRVGIGGADHHGGDSRMENGFDAGRGLPVSGAWLECHVDGGTSESGNPCPGRRILNRLDLGVRPSRPAMPAASDDLSISYDDGPDGRVRAGQPEAAFGERECFAEEVLVVELGIGHGGESTGSRRECQPRIRSKGPCFRSCREVKFRGSSAMRSFGFLVLSFCLFLLPVVGADKPNVIIVYTDDQGSVDANCYGSQDLATPNIDRLAETGVRFTQMLAPSAICSASRAGLLTGQIPARAGVPANVSSAKGNSGMPGEKTTIAELLRSAGYATGHIGKWHLGYTPETMPNAQGFDYSFGHMGGCIDNYSHFFYWNGPNRHDLWRNGEEIWQDGVYFGDSMVDELKGFIDREKEGPFFVYWAINWPHYPLQGTEKWRAHYEGLPHPRDKYAAFLSTTDELLGQLLDHLESLNLRENTIVIFQSDHGHSVEERTFGGGGSAGPYRGHKGNLFEGGIRVPSVVSWPARLPKGEVRDQLVTGMDWFPTLAEWTGAVIAEERVVDGKSLAAVVEENAESAHEDVYWRLGGNPANAKWVVRKGNWKLLGNTRENVVPEGVSELTEEDKKLFLANLEDDIGETTNVAAENPGVVEELLEIRKRYEASLANSGDE